jgi:hypothetical protein
LFLIVLPLQNLIILKDHDKLNHDNELLEAKIHIYLVRRRYR